MSDSEALDIAIKIAAKDAEEKEAAAMAPPPPPPPPPSSAPPPSPLPRDSVSEDDVAKATHTLFTITPSLSTANTTTASSRSRSTVKRPLNSAAAQRARSLSQKKAKLSAESRQPRQPKLDGAYFQEYAMNSQRLLAGGVTHDEQAELEKGLSEGKAILIMQREKIASILARRNAPIAPRPSADASKKGGPAK